MKTLLIVCLALMSFCLLNPFARAETKPEIKHTPAEEYVLEQVKTGRVADLEERFPNEKARLLRSHFFESLLTGSIKDLKVPGEVLLIKSAHINESLDFKYETIPFHVRLIDCHFLQEVDFRGSIFNGQVAFRNSKFYEKIDFNSAVFSNLTDFTKSEFEGHAYFTYCKFIKKAIFEEAIFGVVDFIWSEFLDTAFFSKTKFSQGLFISCKFSELTDFSDARFIGRASFEKTIFRGMVNFYGTTFSGQFGVDFSSCSFKDRSIFRACRYHITANFNDVTSFSGMQMEWEYDPVRFGREKDELKIKHRGLKRQLEYNETFYVALIKNYRDMGWFTEADDCYYTYRVEKRENRKKNLNQKRKSKELPFPSYWFERAKIEAEWLLLALPFGYAIKPWHYLWTFIAFWIPFSLYYLGFVRSNYGQKHPWWQAWNPFYLPSRFLWSLIYSLDTITPGVNFESLKSLKQKVLIKSDSKRILYARRFQQILGWYWAALFLILFSKIWIR